MDKEPIVELSSSFKGSITVSDLLSSEGTINFITDETSTKRGGFLFQIDGFDFVFCLSFQNNAIVFQRNNIVSVLNLDDLFKENSKIMIFARWRHSELMLDCRAGDTIRQTDVPTDPTAPPAKLVTWARKQSLLPVEIYSSEEDFREKIHSSLNTINHKIREADAFKSFWNFIYKGNEIVERNPKKEVEIQPLIHCFLSDQMLLSNIEIVPEFKTGEGNLDFLFIGQVKGLGLCKLCAEFKLAHSKDIDNGLWEQLPKYMDVSNATYGVYCFLNFKCNWYNFPTFEHGETLDIHLSLIPPSAKKPVHKNIRNFIFNLGKPTTASKKSKQNNKD